MKQPRRYPRYGSLIEAAKAAGRLRPTDQDIAGHLAISPARVARHRKILGQ
jgi:hypothetical protein